VSTLRDLGGGVHRWTARHPDWHPRTDFGAEVACFAICAPGRTLLIDPLLAGTVAAELDGLVSGDVTIAVTIPYHVRDAAAAARRWDGTVIGHPDVARRLPDGTPFRGVAPGEELPGGLSVLGIPRRKEQPIYVAGARALAFGDAVVGIGGELRVWVQAEITDQRRAWYRRQLIPALEPLLALDCERVLVTHGPPALHDGRAALAAAFAAEPWFHRST
jgi:hypothetical protein